MRIQGARAVVEETVGFRAIALRARAAQIDGQPGIAVASGSNLHLVIAVRIVEKRIVHFDVIADPQRLAVLNVS